MSITIQINGCMCMSLPDRITISAGDKVLWHIFSTYQIILSSFAKSSRGIVVLVHLGYPSNYDFQWQRWHNLGAPSNQVVCFYLLLMVGSWWWNRYWSRTRLWILRKFYFIFRHRRSLQVMITCWLTLVWGVVWNNNTKQQQKRGKFD